MYSLDVPYRPKAGRKNEFSQEDFDNIIFMAKHTLVLTNICGKVGRDRDTILGWLARGQKEHLNEQDTLLAQFFLSFKNAVADFVLGLEDRLLNADEKTWQRIAWYLERTAREDYGQDSYIIQEIHRNFEILKNAMNGAK